MELLFFIIKKDKISFVILMIELAIIYLLFNLSFSCILQSVKLFGGEQNDDAVTIFSYIVVAAITIYFFTIALQNVIDYNKNKNFYQICLSLGASKNTLLLARVAFLLTIYSIAFCVGFIIALFLDLKYIKEDGIKFYTFSGQVVSIAVYIFLLIINIIVEIGFIKKQDSLIELLGGTDDV